MGLDMYLMRKSAINTGEWVKPEFRDEITIKRGGKDVDTRRVRYVEEEVGYWRKANAIHRWFVENVQNGEDDCKIYPVTVDDLAVLRNLCQDVLESKDREKAERELPTQPGFFFGNTEYEADYTEDLKRTIEIVDRILEEEATISNFSSFTYQSSW